MKIKRAPTQAEIAMVKDICITAVPNDDCNGAILMPKAAELFPYDITLSEVAVHSDSQVVVYGYNDEGTGLQFFCGLGNDGRWYYTMEVLDNA